MPLISGIGTSGMWNYPRVYATLIPTPSSPKFPWSLRFQKLPTRKTCVFFFRCCFSRQKQSSFVLKEILAFCDFFWRLPEYPAGWDFWMENVPPEGNINRQNGRLEIRFRGHCISSNQQPPLFWLGWLKIVASQKFTKLLSDVLQVPNQVTLSPTVVFDRGKIIPTTDPWQLGPCFFAIN